MERRGEPATADKPVPDRKSDRRGRLLPGKSTVAATLLWRSSGGFEACRGLMRPERVCQPALLEAVIAAGDELLLGNLRPTASCARNAPSSQPFSGQRSPKEMVSQTRGNSLKCGARRRKGRRCASITVDGVHSGHWQPVAGLMLARHVVGDEDRCERPAGRPRSKEAASSERSGSRDLLGHRRQGRRLYGGEVATFLLK
jgi:hypothetical protein